jgi:hypothetical protein
MADINVFGQAYALTLLSPIIGGHTHGAVHATRLRAAINAIPTGAASPLARIPTLHLARFVVLDDLHNQGMPAKEDHLRNKYLVFVADFDGALAPFLDALVTHAGDLATSIWRHCEAFPGIADRAAFAKYIAKCQVPSTFPFGAYAEAPLSEVLRSLDAQRRFVEFLRLAQGLPAEQFQQRFRAFAAEAIAAPTPAPATI